MTKKIILRNQLKYVAYAIVVIVMMISIISIFSYINKIDTINSYGDKPYSKDSISFLVENKNEYLNFSFLDDIKEEFIIYKYGEDLGGTTFKVLYCSEKGFELEETINKNLGGVDKLIVGSSTDYLVSDIVFKNEKEYLVVGKIRKSFSETINHGFFCLEQDIMNVPNDTSFIVSCKSINETKIVFEYIENCFKSCGINVKTIEHTMTEMNDFIKYNNYIILIKFVFIVFCLVILVLQFFLWKSITKKEIYIHYLLGDKSIRFKLRLKQLRILMYSLIISTFLGFLIH